MKFPDDLRYAATHEWVRTESDGTLSTGISDHAQDMLGDLVFVELPEPETVVAEGDEVCVIESVKAASDILAPVDGEIVEVNDKLADKPGLVNEDPLCAANIALAESPESVNRDPYSAWLFRVKPVDPAAVSRLMDAATYRQGLDKAAT